MTKTDPRNVCDACRQSLDRRLRSHVELGPIVHDHIWQQLADAGERLLCDTCMFRRAWERFGRMLTLADLRPCPWNLFLRPHSWFDLFMRAGQSRRNLADWHSASRDLGIAPP
jgi:hypothetical protein